MGCGISRHQNINEPLVSNENGEIKTIQDIKVSNLTFFDESQKKISDVYDIRDTIHFSKFGFVKKVTKKDTREQRIVKIVNKKYIDHDRSQYQIANEVANLSKLNHPNIVQVFEYFRDEINYYFIYEFIDSGSLIDQLIESNTFTENMVKIIIKQILEALAYIHSNKIAHREISLKNILASSLGSQSDTLKVKLIHWYNASKVPASAKFEQGVGDIHYRAPEVIQKSYDLSCDIWSVGIVLYTLIEGEMPFHAKKEEDIAKAILENTPTFDSSNWVGISNECKSITEQMLQKDPRRRPIASELLKSEWFKEKTAVGEDTVILKSKHVDNMVKVNFIKINLSFCKFQAYNILQKAALTYIATQEISKFEQESIQQIFSKIDTQKDGTLSKDEISKVCQFKFNTMKGTDILEIFENLDSNKNGKIDYNEFITSVQERKKLEREENIKKAFQYFDKDQNGTICLNELKQSLGYSLQQKNEKAWQDLMSRYDMDGDNKISYSEFKVIVQSFQS